MSIGEIEEMPPAQYNMLLCLHNWVGCEDVKERDKTDKMRESVSCSECGIGLMVYHRDIFHQQIGTPREFWENRIVVFIDKQTGGRDYGSRKD